jgi:hypothetical protein
MNCIGCGVKMRKPQSKVCQLCCRKHELFDIKTATDYRLTSDATLNGIAFLHACGNGILDAFFDKCFTATDAFIEELDREPRIHVNDVDPASVEAYEDHESNWYEISTLKSPETTVARKIKQNMERKLSK